MDKANLQGPPASLYPEDSEAINSCQGESLVNVSYLNRIFQTTTFNNVSYVKEIACHDPLEVPRKWKRKGIISFSKQSRKRLFQLLAKVQEIEENHPVHITLTYHNNYDLASRKHSQDLHSFLVQVKRIFPELGYIWRLELQKRGAPHFHIMFFLSDFNSDLTKILFYQTCRDIWHRVADSNSEEHRSYGCKMTEIGSYRHACAYLSKYIAKEEKEQEHDLKGRRWGSSRNLRTDEIDHMRLNDHEVVKLGRMLRNWLHSKKRSNFKWYKNLGIKYNFHVYCPHETFIKMAMWSKGIKHCGNYDWIDDYFDIIPF